MVTHLFRKWLWHALGSLSRAQDLFTHEFCLGVEYQMLIPSYGTGTQIHS